MKHIGWVIVDRQGYPSYRTFARTLKDAKYVFMAGLRLSAHTEWSYWAGCGYHAIKLFRETK